VYLVLKMLEREKEEMIPHSLSQEGLNLFLPADFDALSKWH